MFCVSKNFGGKCVAGPVLSLLLPVALGIAYLSCNAYAEIGSSDVDFSLSVDATPSLEIVLAGDGLTTSPTSLGLNIKPNIDGTPVFGYSDLDVTVATSNATGYYLNFSTTNADGSLRTTGSNTLSTLADSGTFTCTTATASTCSFTTNRWGYKLAQDDATSYIAAPGSDGTKIDEIYTTTNGVTSNLRVGAKVDSSLTAGNYSTTMSFAATAHPTPYGIYYNYGAAEGTSPAPSGLPGNQSGALNNASTTTVTLSSSTPTWTGHTFNKWCLGTITSTEYANDTCTGTEYSPGDTITFSMDDVVSVTLKAMWNINSYSIKYGTANGISKVTLDGQECTAAVSGTGCTKTLIYGKSYSLVATLNTGYSLSTWTATAGSVANNTASTTYTVGAGNATITPGATLNQYNVTVTFNTGANQVSFTNATYGTVTATASSPTVSLYYNQPYTATMSFSDNYEFSSWTAGTNTSVSSTGTNPTTITLTGTGNGTITANGKSSKIYMQNMTASLCTTTAQTAYDNRDEQAYTIQRLADGRCWMMTNLNLGATTLSTDLTSSNTNLSSTVTASTFNSWKKSSGTGTYTAAEYIPLTASNTSNGLDTDPTSGTTYGTLYNYCAASAGTYCTDPASGPGNESADICPKGWRLPTDNTGGEFATLYANASYNTNAKMRASVANGGAAFALAGNFLSSTPTNQGKFGFYWSSTRYSNSVMYYLDLNTSDVYPSSINDRNRGYSIRCILEDRDITGVTYLQDVNHIVFNNTTVGTTATLTDSRTPSTSYQVKMLSLNGTKTLWMMSNLKLPGGTALTTSNSNVTASYTLPSDTGSSGWVNDYCKPYMASKNGEYYYNWPAATARTNSSSTSGCSNDTSNSVGDICPKGWRLPVYGDVNDSTWLSNLQANGSLTTTGYFYLGSQSFVGSDGYWWTSTRISDSDAGRLNSNGSTANVYYNNKIFGFSVRCMRTS